MMDIQSILVQSILERVNVMTLSSLQFNRPINKPMPQFAARKKAAPVKPPEAPKPTPVAFPLYTITTSNGDGSYSTHYFTNKTERDKALTWLEKNDDELPCDADGTLDERDIYQSAADFIADRS
jgi:hypothetical protein